MKCAFEPCRNSNEARLTLTDGESGEIQRFCGYAHLLAWLVMHLGESTRTAIEMALAASQSSDGRKMIVKWLADKVL